MQGRLDFLARTSTPLTLQAPPQFRVFALLAALLPSSEWRWALGCGLPVSVPGFVAVLAALLPSNKWRWALGCGLPVTVPGFCSPCCPSALHQVALGARLWLARPELVMHRASSGLSLCAALLPSTEWRWALARGLPVLRRQFSLNHSSSFDLSTSATSSSCSSRPDHGR